MEAETNVKEFASRLDEWYHHRTGFYLTGNLEIQLETLECIGCPDIIRILEEVAYEADMQE